MVTSSGIVDLELGWSHIPGMFDAAWNETCGRKTQVTLQQSNQPWINTVEQWAQENPCICKQHREGRN